MYVCLTVKSQSTSVTGWKRKMCPRKVWPRPQLLWKEEFKMRATIHVVYALKLSVTVILPLYVQVLSYLCDRYGLDLIDDCFKYFSFRWLLASMSFIFNAFLNGTNLPSPVPLTLYKHNIQIMNQNQSLNRNKSTGARGAHSVRCAGSRSVWRIQAGI